MGGEIWPVLDLRLKCLKTDVILYTSHIKRELSSDHEKILKDAYVHMSR